VTKENVRERNKRQKRDSEEGTNRNNKEKVWRPTDDDQASRQKHPKPGYYQVFTGKIPGLLLSFEKWR
jgi:hypothetical protein